MIDENKIVEGEEVEVEVPAVEEPATEPETEFKKKPEDEEDKKDSPDDDSQKKDKDDSEDKDDSDESKKEDKEDDDDEDEKKKKKMNHSASEDDDEEKCPECGKPKSECTCDEDDKKKYSLEEIPEYVELATQYAAAMKKIGELEAEIAPLREFKNKADKAEKQAMIDSFYMLSDADKAEVINNIDNYSVNDIEAKLAVICVRNKVNFNLDNEDKKDEGNEPTVYSLTDNDVDDGVPAWIKAVRDTAKTMIN